MCNTNMEIKQRVVRMHEQKPFVDNPGSTATGFVLRRTVQEDKQYLKIQTDCTFTKSQTVWQVGRLF